MFPINTKVERETLMSRGPGHIQRKLERVFANNPDGVFILEDFIECAYSGLKSSEKKHRVAVARAAKAVAGRVGWNWRHGNGAGSNLIFFNMRSVPSSLTAKCLFYTGRNYADRRRPLQPHELESAASLMDAYALKDWLPKTIEQVEIWRAELDG
jgi:hypothetical protein